MDEMIRVQVKTINGQKFSVQLRSSDTTGELIRETSRYSGHSQNTIRLIYCGKDISTRKQKTLKENQINNGGVCFMVHRLVGGMKAFGTVLFNSMEKQVSIKFNSFAPEWRVVTPGLNLKGKCNNQKCPANKQVIWIQKGFGTFFINKEVQISQCPKCKKKAQDITNFGYYRCKIKVDGQAKDQKPFKFEDSHVGEENMKTFSEDNDKMLEWNYLIIEVSKN